MPPHADDRRRISVLVGGSLEERVDGRTEQAGIGSVAIKGGDVVHANAFGTQGATIVSAILPDSLVSHIGVDPGLVRDWQWRHGVDDTLAALRLALGLLQHDRDAVRVELMSLLSRFSIATDPVAPAPARMRLLAVELARDPFAVTSTSVWDPRPGRHPASLRRVFRRHIGTSMSRYRQRARVVAVARALLATSLSLTAIAVDHGFSDLSHMTRVFRRELGVPPGRFRRVLRDHPAAPTHKRRRWHLAV